MTSDLFYETLQRRRGYTNPNNHDFCEGCGETPYNADESRQVGDSVLGLNGAGTCQNCAENICQVSLQDWNGNQCCKPAAGDMIYDGYSLKNTAWTITSAEPVKNTFLGRETIVRMCAFHMSVINSAIKRSEQYEIDRTARRDSLKAAAKRDNAAQKQLDEITLLYPDVAESMRIGIRGKVEIDVAELAALIHAVGLRNFHNAKEAYEGTK